MAYALRAHKITPACDALGRALEDVSYYVRAVALESSVLACPRLAAGILARSGASAAPYEPLRSMIRARRTGDKLPSEIPFIKRQCAHEYLSHTHDQIEGFTPLGRPRPGPLDID